MVCMVRRPARSSLIQKLYTPYTTNMARARMPKPGSLPLPSPMKEGARRAPLHPAQFAPPPFAVSDGEGEEQSNAQQAGRKNLKKLQAARRNVRKLEAIVRDEAFDDWIRRCVVNAERPDQWTQARTLYANYAKRAADYGSNRAHRALLKQEIATETQWGKMMGALFPKKRRAAGWFYPVLLKRGA